MTKKKSKGWIIGGVIGFLISLVLMKYGTSENIFRVPPSMIIDFYCLFNECSNVLGYALMFVIITILFYSLLGIIFGIIIGRIMKK